MDRSGQDRGPLSGPPRRLPHLGNGCGGTVPQETPENMARASYATDAEAALPRPWQTAHGMRLLVLITSAALPRTRARQRRLASVVREKQGHSYLALFCARKPAGLASRYGLAGR